MVSVAASETAAHVSRFSISVKVICFLFCLGLLSFICPCIQFGRNAEALGESCVMYALSQFVPLLNIYCRVSVRGKIREQKGIDGSCFKDLLCSWCCGPCALAQEAQVSTNSSQTTFAQTIIARLTFSLFLLVGACRSRQQVNGPRIERVLLSNYHYITILRLLLL